MAISSSATGLRPGVCTSTTRPTAPYNGQLIYETDTRKVYIYNGTSWVEQPTAGMVDAKGDLLVGTAADTAARLAVGANNTVLVADSAASAGVKWAELSAIGGAWTAYTPTIVPQSGTITTASAVGRFGRIQQTVFFRFQISITNKGTGAGALYVTVPVTAQSGYGSGTAGAVGSFSEWTSIGFIGTTNLFNSVTELALLRYDWATPIVNGTISGFAIYEAA